VKPPESAVVMPLSIDDARDQKLLGRYLAGDAAALEELLVSVEPRLMAICYRMAGEAQEAQDLCQEAMVKIIQGLSGFGGRSKLSTWMIRVTMNVCLTERRRSKVRRTVSLDDAGTRGKDGVQRPLSETIRGGGPGAIERIEQEEMLRRLSLGMDRIDADQRAMLILRDASGLDYSEIADILGIPVGTVKSRIFRARAALRECMERIDPASAADA